MQFHYFWYYFCNIRKKSNIKKNPQLDLHIYIFQYATFNLYLISQNTNRRYDTFDSAVVAAYSEDEATYIHPDGGSTWDAGLGWNNEHGTRANKTWPSPDNITVVKIGIAESNVDAGEVVLSSFNAG